MCSRAERDTVWNAIQALRGGCPNAYLNLFVFAFGSFLNATAEKVTAQVAAEGQGEGEIGQRLFSLAVQRISEQFAVATRLGTISQQDLNLLIFALGVASMLMWEEPEDPDGPAPVPSLRPESPADVLEWLAGTIREDFADEVFDTAREAFANLVADVNIPDRRPEQRAAAAMGIVGEINDESVSSAIEKILGEMGISTLPEDEVDPEGE